MSVERDRRGDGWIAPWRLPLLFSTYAHLIDEYAEQGSRVDAEAEITKARAISCASGQKCVTAPAPRSQRS